MNPLNDERITWILRNKLEVSVLTVEELVIVPKASKVLRKIRVDLVDIL